MSDTCDVLLEAADEGVQSLEVHQLANKLTAMQAVADDTGKANTPGTTDDDRRPATVPVLIRCV